MISYKMYEKTLISSINVNVIHHVWKSEILSISLKICISQCHNSICIRNEKSCACHKPSIPSLFHTNFLRAKKQNMNGLVNRLLRY